LEKFKKMEKNGNYTFDPTREKFSKILGTCKKTSKIDLLHQT
jgi:hypothetical protein